MFRVETKPNGERVVLFAVPEEDLEQIAIENEGLTDPMSYLPILVYNPVSKKFQVHFLAGSDGFKMLTCSVGEFELNYFADLVEGGLPGQVLTRTGSGNVDWASVPEELPEGGTDGQVLKIVDGSPAWASVPEELPEGGTDGQVLKIVDGSPAWAADATE